MEDFTDAMWGGEVIRAPIPNGRDPFINTPLLRLGQGPDGEERFWISSWNSSSGCMGVLVTESGKERIYRFPPPHGGFYSAAPEDEDTLWLCGDLSRVVRLTLSTGELETYGTDAPSALVFQGMILDPASGKLFAAAHASPATYAFSFDYRNRKPVRVYTDVCTEHYMRSSFANGDGTYSCVLVTPDVSLLHWNPQQETVETVNLTAQLSPQLRQKAGVNRLIGDKDGRRYFPHWGWYNPIARKLESDGPRPEKEAVWFARNGESAWGLSADGEKLTVALWDMATGCVSNVCTVPDAHIGSVNVTSSGQIVAVNVFGGFFRFDGRIGTMGITRRLPTDSVGHVDCLCRIDKDRLLGTTFITQRFWEIDLKTGRGYDCGRAAPGFGEVLQTWNVGGKLYMAAYAGGELVEYNPEEHPHFPENPRVVAIPPGGMRPVAATGNGRFLYYACSHEYGKLGCVLTQYDTESGAAAYRDDPIPGQMIRSLYDDIGTNTLFAGTTMEADCQSCPPESPLCYFARIDKRDLSVIGKYAAPEGTTIATVHGPVGHDRILCTVSGHFAGDSRTRWFMASALKFDVPDISAMKILPDNAQILRSAGKPGLFILKIDDRFELWDVTKWRRQLILYRDSTVYLCHVQDQSVYLATLREIVVLEDCLSGY